MAPLLLLAGPSRQIDAAKARFDVQSKTVPFPAEGWVSG